MYRLINDYAGSVIPRRLDLEFRGRDRVIYVEEKNVKTLSTTKLHVFKEMIIDIYLNVKRGVKVVWHFSEHGTGSIYRTIVHALSVFRVEYWVGSHTPTLGDSRTLKPSSPFPIDCPPAAIVESSGGYPNAWSTPRR